VPQGDQLLEQLGVLVGEVVDLGAVLLQVVERPVVLGEVTPVRWGAGMQHDRLPAVAPDRTRAEHHIELARLQRLRIGIVEGVAEARALDGPLRVALDDLGRLDAEALVDGRENVAAVRVLVAQLTPGLDPLWPVDDHRVSDAAFPGVALEQLARRVERHRPAGGVMVVGLRRAELVDVFQVVVDVVHHSVEERVLVDRAARAPLARGAVIRDPDDQRVVQLASLLQIVDQPADLVIGVAAVPGVHLGHSAHQPLLVLR
jgi:hypothetical protein